MAKKNIESNKKNKMPISYKKYKNIKLGTIVCLDNKEKNFSKKNYQKIFAIKGFCFSNDSTVLPKGTIGIVIGYKYRKIRHIFFLKSGKKNTINKTKWFQILIENNVYLVLEKNISVVSNVKK